jgi:hypothetical protein
MREVREEDHEGKGFQVDRTVSAKGLRLVYSWCFQVAAQEASVAGAW